LILHRTDLIKLNAMLLFQHSVLWALIVGVILAFLLGVAMGGNDVANAFGTSVGSGVLTIIQAYIMASIFETLGAVLVGWSVTDTMRKGVVDTQQYENNPKELMLGQVAILGGCAGWLLIATLCRMPVSTTHSLVGATLGFSIVLRGFHGIRWMKIVDIVVSWFLSPALSGTISVILYMIVDFSVLRRKKPFECGLRVLPIFYFICIAFDVLMITLDGSRLLKFDKIPVWGAVIISLGCGLIAAAFVQFVMKPRFNRKIQSLSFLRRLTFETLKKGYSNIIRYARSCSVRSFLGWFFPDKDRIEDDQTIKLFSTIQVRFDLYRKKVRRNRDRYYRNAIAPLTALVSIYKDKNAMQEGEVPIYILLYGVFGICVGLWTLGHRVIRTVGTNMSEINPATGFTIEFGAAMTALISSKLGLPISTTHCLVRMLLKTKSLTILYSVLSENYRSSLSVSLCMLRRIFVYQHLLEQA
uniref:Phosphate transporter n=1 Tax=Haemonchus placei TaxID=6290 RepID=A0A158QQN5_HAEPC